LALCSSSVAEGLRLEFKLKENPNTADLSKIDKRAIAEAVSSFANSDGGTLIYGIRSERTGGLDVAAELVPIANVDQFLKNLELVCGLNISPELRLASARVIYATPGSADGFLICEVPRSDRRPHMSTAQGVHSYFRRSFEGSALMTPSEIRDQILAVRDAILEPVVVYGAGGSFSNQGAWISARIPVQFSLKNVGQALCRNPFLRVKASCALYSHSATYDYDLGAWKTLFPYGTLIHVDDQQSCLGLNLNACIRLDVLSALFERNSGQLAEAVIVLPGGQEYHASTITDKVSLEEVEFVLRHGAENATVNETVLGISRMAFAKRILTNSTVRDMALQSTGNYRADLVQSFTSEIAERSRDSS
jgi:hypothetical protein